MSAGSLSKITFSGLKARTWTPEAGYSTEPGYNADSYVFAVLAATEHERYDPTGHRRLAVLGDAAQRPCTGESFGGGRLITSPVEAGKDPALDLEGIQQTR